MYRNIINDLATWFEEKRRRILYIKGAYGVGKTWSVKDFATAFFEDQGYIDINEDSSWKSIISGTPDKEDTDTRIKLMDEKLANVFPEMDFNKNSSLLIFDGVQGIPSCAEFFYAFRKAHKDYTICLISEGMQITEYEYHYKDVFNIIRMRPMTFEEYMIATKSHPLIAAIENQKSMPLDRITQDAVTILLKEYLQTGGMPAVVSAFIKKKDYNVIRPIQLGILEDYRKLIKNSFSDAMSDRCRRIWKSVPNQLTNNNKKFMYRLVENNARAREYADAAQNLCNLGIVRKLPRLAEGVLPLEDHVDYKSFELFMIDHGLLRAVYELPISEKLTAYEILTEKNGAVAEQFIFEELSSKVGNIYYWISGATARVPFVYEGEQAPIPVDIRFKPNKKAQNIKTFCAKNKNTEQTVKVSLTPIERESNTLNIPAYGLWNM